MGALRVLRRERATLQVKEQMRNQHLEKLLDFLAFFKLISYLREVDLLLRRQQHRYIMPDDPDQKRDGHDGEEHPDADGRVQAKLGLGHRGRVKVGREFLDFLVVGENNQLTGAFFRKDKICFAKPFFGDAPLHKDYAPLPQRNVTSARSKQKCSQRCHF